jgi:hypothetical protein
VGPTLKWNQPFPHEVPQFPMTAHSAVSSSSYNDIKRSRAAALLAEISVEGGKEAAVHANTRQRRKFGIPDHCIPLPPEHVYKSNIVGSKRPLLSTSKQSGNFVRNSAEETAGSTEVSVKQQRKKRIASIQANRDSLAMLEGACDVVDSSSGVTSADAV